MSRYKVKRKLKIDLTEIKCEICGKICKGVRLLKSHNTQMHLGEKDTSHRGKPKGTPSWNKGLTKKTDERVLKNTESVSKTIQNQIKNGTYVPRKMGDDAKRKLSERQSIKNSGGKSKWYEVNGIKVQGTWERDVAIKLTEMNIDWIKPKTNNYIFKYEVDGKIKSYTPDFYLPSFDVYLEIKGYWWGRDREKMDLVISKYPETKFVIIEKEKFIKILGGEQVW